jgi:hypothetical protein
VLYLGIFQGINLGNILGNFPTYSRKNSYEFFHVNFSDILFHWRRIFRWVNLGVSSFLGVFYSKKFFLGSSLSRPSYLRGGWWRHLELLLHFEVLKNSYISLYLFYKLLFSKSKSNDLDGNWLNYGTFESGGHLKFLRHFVLLIFKIGMQW